MNREQARQIALNHIANDEFVILDRETEEKEFGWVFFYQSKMFVETGDIGEMLAGNGPIIVDKLGAVHVLTTAYSINEQLAEFERKAKN